jgi:hypothetical protein
MGGLLIRETVAILDLLGVDHSPGAIWNLVHMLSEVRSNPLTAAPSGVVVDKIQFSAEGEKK